MEWYWAFALLLGMIVGFLALGFPVALAFVTVNIFGWLLFTGWNPESVLQVVSNGLVIPIEHHENLYDLPIDLGSALQRAIRDTALAMKAAFGCDGVSTRQHNEPAGNQDVWHYHVHVFPRFHDDDLYRGCGCSLVIN